MTEKNILLVKHSWSYVAGQLDNLSPLFAKKLQKVRPELKLVIQKLETESRLDELMATVHQMVAALPNLQSVEKHLLAVYTVYSNFGITKNDFDHAMIAFLMTLEKKLGKSWSPEIREAWVFVFVTVYRQVLKKSGAIERTCL